jgi:Ca-activated chloride channel family protein
MIDIHQLQFESPLILLILPVILLIAIWRFIRTPEVRTSLLNESDSSTVFYHPSEILFSQHSRQQFKTTERLPFIPLLLYLSLITCLLTALAGPYIKDKQLPDNPAYRDTLFLVDNEISMVLRDYLVNGKRTDRLTMVKSTLSHFIKELQGNRIGIITFSERADMLVPMTFDSHLLLYQINRIQPTLTGRTSDPANAMRYAMQQLEQQYAGSNTRPTLVLLTAVHRPPRDIDPAKMAALLAAKGYRLHVIAIGSGTANAAESAPASLIYQPANYRLLEAIAKAGNGKFYLARNTDSLSDAVRTIRESEKTKEKPKPRFTRQPLYYWPLLAAMLIILLQTVLPFFTRKPAR